MPDTVTIKVSGLKTIDAALRELPKAVQDQVLGQALVAAAGVLKRGVAERIRDRSGRTAADLDIAIEVSRAEVAGQASISGHRGKGGRAYILNFLERGAKPHMIRPGIFKLRRKVARLARRDPALAIATAEADSKAKRGLAFQGIVRASVKHPGTHGQAPMRLALASRGEEAIRVFGRTAWAGILRTVARVQSVGV